MANSVDQSALTDLKVTLETLTTVVPERPTPQEYLFLSNIDQTVVFPVETVYFYRRKSDMDPSDLLERIKEALTELLVPYYFLAGRLRVNPETGRLDIDCNGGGIPLAGASSEVTMDDLGEIGFANTGYKSLILQVEAPSPPLVTLQVTRFKCSGFAVGLCTNHALFDGLAVSQFLQNLASITRGSGLVFHPLSDRSCLKARDPPIISYEHLEHIKLTDLRNGNSGSAFASRGTPEENFNICKVSSLHTYRSFPFPSHRLKRLTEKALEDGFLQSCSTFDAIVALVWQARVKSMEYMDPSEPTSVLFAVDIRKLMQPPLPATFAGNGVLTAYARATTGELREKSLSFCVSKVQEGIARVTDNYIRSAIDWLEMYKGIPAAGVHGSFFMSAWWKLPFHKLDFGWGEPVYAGPTMTGIIEVVLLISDCGKDEGLNLLLALRPHEMTKFEGHINQVIS